MIEAGASEGMAEPALRIIDCHVLIASADQLSFPLAPGIGPLRPGELEGSLSPEQMRQSLQARAPVAAVLVQRGRFYGFDNRLVAQAATEGENLRAICAVDARLPDAAMAARHWLGQPNVSGIRMMEPEKGAHLDWLAGDHALGVWQAAADTGALVDVHVFPWNRAAALPELARLLRRFPQVRVVLDNLGNGPVETGAPDFGIDALMLREFADAPQLSFKFSEMTLDRLDGAGLDHATAIARHAALLGAERLLWGSDIIPPGMGLADAAMRAQQATAGLGLASRRLILSGNAERLFGFTLA